MHQPPVLGRFLTPRSVLATVVGLLAGWAWFETAGPDAEYLEGSGCEQ